jgi:hypothetical protein
LLKGNGRCSALRESLDGIRVLAHVHLGANKENRGTRAVVGDLGVPF